MRGDINPSLSDEPTRRERFCNALALGILLICVSVRPFLSELPFRISATKFAQTSEQRGVVQGRFVSPSLPSRAIFAVALILAGGIWLIGAGSRRSAKLSHPTLAVLIVVFAVLSAASAWGASNQRSAWVTWAEQVSLLTAAFLAVQLCARRRIFLLLAAVLAAVGLTMAVKGYWQVFVEFPVIAENVRMYGAGDAADIGQPLSPQAQMFEKRLLGTTPYGFMALSNPFASMLMVMGFAAAGLAAHKFIKWRNSPGSSAKTGQRGEIPLPLLAAIVTAIACVSMVVVFALTRSRGAIASAGVAAPLAVWIYRKRSALFAHRRRWLLIAAAAVVLGVTFVAAWGLARDSLPTKTMTYRWYYWSGTGGIVLEKPILGVGPGNFPDAYLAHRRADAEEAVKMPHNVIAHALSQYGLGGLCYLGIVVYVLTGLAGTGGWSKDNSESKSPAGAVRAILILLIVSAVVAGRWIFVGTDSPIDMVIIEVLFPAGILAVALVLALWTGSSAAASRQAYSALRIALACGLVGFALHNMVTFSLWIPSAALVFWAGAGACLATGPRRIVRAQVFHISAAAWILVAVAVAIIICIPIIGSWRASEKMARSLKRGDYSTAIEQSELAANRDRLDARLAADAAIVLDRASESTSPNRQGELRLRAYRWALEAISRDRGHYAHHSRAARIARLIDGPTREKSLEHMDEAVRLNPMDARMRIEYAGMLREDARPTRCGQQVREALSIDAKLPANSVARLTPEHLKEVEVLLAWSNSRVEKGRSQ